ncbi:MAG: signal peptidase I [Gemmatimonadetes bacterium]|nr:MAG: signal peptidase I [Gemmatimonadota bacterium]
MQETYAAQGMSSIVLICWLAVVVLLIASMWKVFTKAGKPGWAAIIPIYNLIVILQIAGKPIWWFFLLLIPLVNLVVGIMTYVAFAKNFGKGVGFALGLIFLGFIFFPILAWGSAQYQAPAPSM